MMLELAAIASTVAGALLLRKKSTDEETKTDYAPDVEVEEAPEGDFEPVVEEPAPEPEPAAPSAPADPRDGELYFGDKSQPYDPFYDYSKGGIYAMSKYQLSSIEGNDETLAQAYRMRILRPFFGYETAKRPKTANGQYRNNGLPMQTLEKGGKFLNVMPFVRGDYTNVRFLLEVFNPFDFDAPLQKLRISAVSSGGKECYIIPQEVEGAYSSANASDPRPLEIFDPYFSSQFLFFGNGDLRFSKTSLAFYQSHYQYRFGATDVALNDNEWSNNELPYQPSDFEIYCVKNCSGIIDDMRAYDSWQWGAVEKKDGDWHIRKLNPAGAVDRGPGNKSLCDKLGYEVKTGSTEKQSLAERLPIYEGMKHPLDGVKEFITIPARGSILLDITLPIASKVQGKYWKQDHVYNRRNPSNTMMDSMKFNVLRNWDTGELSVNNMKFNTLSHLKGCDQGALHKLIFTSGLGEGYVVNGVKKKDNKGGFLFIDTFPVETMSESDFRLKIAAFSDKKQSVIQGHKSGEFARSGFSSPYYEVGMYRGGRPNGTYEWWKSYWEDVTPAADSGSVRKNFNENISAAGVNVDEYETLGGMDEIINLS